MLHRTTFEFEFQDQTCGQRTGVTNWRSLLQLLQDAKDLNNSSGTLDKLLKYQSGCRTS